MRRKHAQIACTSVLTRPGPASKSPSNRHGSADMFRAMANFVTVDWRTMDWFYHLWSRSTGSTGTGNHHALVVVPPQHNPHNITMSGMFWGRLPAVSTGVEAKSFRFDLPKLQIALLLANNQPKRPKLCNFAFSFPTIYIISHRINLNQLNALFPTSHPPRPVDHVLQSADTRRNPNINAVVCCVLMVQRLPPPHLCLVF